MAKKLDALLTDVAEEMRRDGRHALAASILAHRGGGSDPRTDDSLAQLLAGAIRGADR